MPQREFMGFLIERRDPVRYDVDAIAVVVGIDRGVQHADVRAHTAEDEFRHTEAAEPRVEIRLEERAVAGCVDAGRPIYVSRKFRDDLRLRRATDAVGREDGEFPVNPVRVHLP